MFTSLLHFILSLIVTFNNPGVGWGGWAGLCQLGRMDVIEQAK